MYACQSYGWYFYITYLPQFCEAIEQHGPRQNNPIVAALLQRRAAMDGRHRMPGRRLPHRLVHSPHRQSTAGPPLVRRDGHALTAIAFLACFGICSAGRGLSSIFLIIMAAGFCTDLTMGSAWALCQDIGKRYSAIVAGFMNMIGNLGGTLANLISGYVLAGALDAHAAGLGVDVQSLSVAEKNLGPDARLPDHLPRFGRHVHDRFPLLAAHRRHPAGRAGIKSHSKMNPIGAVYMTHVKGSWHENHSHDVFTFSIRTCFAEDSIKSKHKVVDFFADIGHIERVESRM